MPRIRNNSLRGFRPSKRGWLEICIMQSVSATWIICPSLSSPLQFSLQVSTALGRCWRTTTITCRWIPKNTLIKNVLFWNLNAWRAVIRANFALQVARFCCSYYCTFILDLAVSRNDCHHTITGLMLFFIYSFTPSFTCSFFLVCLSPQLI